nr:zinc finger BED domain-containing protein RICESLEEPER 1-like [Populus alba]
MQGFVYACEQLYLYTGEGAAGKAWETCLPSFEPDVKEKHVSDYRLAHHARKYNLNAAVAILLRSTGDDHIYILEFFLPILVKESSEQQDLVEKLKLTIKQNCKSLTMFSKKPSIRKRGSKVSKNNDKIEPAPDPDGNMFIECADNKRRKVSEVWKHFDKVKDKENGVVWAICKGCQKKYPGESTKGTSNLHKHFKSCSKKGQRDAKQHTLPFDLGGNFVFDQERSRLNFVRMIMKLGFPLDMVQNEFFKTFVCNLQPKFQLCSQDIVQADALSIYRQEREKLMKYLDNLSSLFSLAIDLQSHGDNKMSCCLTMHFIDDGWRMNKKILAFRSIEHDYMNEAVKNVLVEWNIIKKVQFMFAEIAPPNSQMTREFRSKLLSQFPHMNGDLLCFSCYAQTLELLARDGFYEIKDVLNKIRGCIEYVNATPINQDKFQKATNHVKLQDRKAASHDDPTRWETTFVMLRSALELREAFTQLEQVDFDFKVNPSAEEWKMAMIVCGCLKVIHKSLGSSSSSIDACFLHVCYIYKNLLSWEKSEHAYVCSMAKRMKENLERYWSEWSFAFGILLVLDPRCKLKFVQYGFLLMYGSDASKYLLEFRSKLTCMYNNYANDTGYIASPASDISCLPSYDLDSDGKFLGFCEWLKVDPPKSDLDRYLGEPVENRDKVSDVLAWWRVNAPRFSTLGKMARDFLAIPISAILSKSAISGEATKVNPSFNGLGPEILEAFICGQDWLESPENNSRKQQGNSEHQMPRHQAGPFKVIKSTSPEDLKLINYIFYSSLDESEIVVHCNHNYLTWSQLRTLRPQTWLDDNVISVMSDALTLAERRKKKGYINWYLPIFFSEYAYDTSECISFAKKNMFRKNYMSALFSCEKMYVPVFDKERRHFYLFVLHIKKQVVEIWDSLAKSSGSSVNKRLPNILAILDILFEDDIQQNYPDGWSFASFSVDRSPNVPQQTNGYDCGVYVIKFMLAPEEATQPDFVFDSDTERLDVVLRLLDGNVNSCRNELAAKAEAYYLRSSGTNDSLRTCVPKMD